MKSDLATATRSGSTRATGPRAAVEAEWTAPSTSGFRATAVAFLWALAIAAPVLAMGAWYLSGIWAARAAEIEAAMAYERVVNAAPEPVLSVEEASHGRDLFVTTCVACHGATGAGVAGLGKNLIQSDFVAGQSDAELLDFLIKGRAVMPVAMPPRGGREDLTDADLRDVVVYLRGLQDPRRMPELSPMAAPAPASEDEKAAALAAAGGDAELAEWIANGTKLYTSTCIACHGANGAGIKGNGKMLANNEFIQSLDDDALLAFIQRGRDPSDPKNTTGVGMPAKGGNPALSEDDILDIICYLRTLQPADAAKGEAGAD